MQISKFNLHHSPHTIILTVTVTVLDSNGELPRTSAETVITNL